VRTRLALLRDLQPSQLFISAAKLRRIESKFNTSHAHGVPPVPVRDAGGRPMLTDGHTRAFALYRGGADRIRVYDDTDDLDWEAYAICVHWCVEEGIEWVGDLDGRVVSPEEFERRWLLRCRRMHEELASRRGVGS
jgi:hypothetical protein